MIMFGSSLPSALGWLVATKVYSGTGADIVMESITLTDPVPSVARGLPPFNSEHRESTGSVVLRIEHVDLPVVRYGPVSQPGKRSARMR